MWEERDFNSTREESFEEDAKHCKHHCPLRWKADWLYELSTLSPTLLQERDPGLEIGSSEIDCFSLGGLMTRYLGATTKHAVDLLLIDVEGFDWNVLRGLDLALHAPKMIIYEQKVLQPEDKAAANKYLRSHGYSVRLESDNVEV
jgi:hypothetical protein